MDSEQLLQAKSISTAVTILSSNKVFHTPRIAKRLAELVEVDKRVWALSLDQGLSSYTRGSKTLKFMREDLRTHHINPLSTDGKLLLRGEPGIKDMLRLPHARASDAKLVEAARRIIKNVRPFKDTFINEGYHPDFLERAEQSVDQFERISSQPAAEVTKRSLATRALPDAIQLGRSIMDAISRLVQTDLARDTVHQKMWKDAHRLPKKMGRPKVRRSRRLRPPPEAES